MTAHSLVVARLLGAAAALTVATEPAVTPVAAPARVRPVERRPFLIALPDERPWSIRATPPPPPVAATPAPPAERDQPPTVEESGDDVATPGSLLVPVRGVRPEQLMDTYTQARGAGRSHDAIDIPAPKGTPVVASADGTVLKKFRSERGGVTLYVLLPDRRTLHYYAHLDRYAEGIAEGKAVRRGDVLAFVGDTGNAGAGNTHLHFEVSTTADPGRFWGGEPRNPYPLLTAPAGPRARAAE